MSVINEVATLQGQVVGESLTVENATVHGEYFEI